MSPSETGDIASGEKSNPPPVADAAPVPEKKEAEKEESAPSQKGQKPASGRKKLASAAMGLISLIMSPKDDKASADGKEKEEEEEVKKPAVEATGADGAKKGTEEEDQGVVKKPAEVSTDGAQNQNAPPDLPSVNPMAMNNSFPMQPANFVNMEATGNGGYGGNRTMYPPPNMMEMPAQYPPLNLPGPSNPSANGGKSFPEILYEIVSNTNNQDIISWLSHGQGFQIHNKQLFAKRILPEYFDGTKFTSFTRRLKRWSFVRVSRGPELGAYYNKNFVRNQPELVQLMRYRLKEESDGSAILPNGQLPVAPGFLSSPNDAGKKRELPDESDVKGTISSMRQVAGGILPQMPHQAWPAAAIGMDGFPQLPRPSQLPKRGKNDDKGKDGGGGETDGAKGTESSAKKPKYENTMYNHSNFPAYGANMQFHPGMMMNGVMHSGMMMNNMMGNSFGGNDMANYPNAGMMSSTSNNEEQPNQMPNQIPNQMMMSTAQGGTGNVMKADTGGGNATGNSGIVPANMPQGNMETSTTPASATAEVTNVEV